MRRLIIGAVSMAIGAATLLYAFPSIITGNAIAEGAGSTLVPIFSVILLLCGLALFVLEAKEVKKKE